MQFRSEAGARFGRATDRGTGLFGSVFGLMIFLVFMLLAVQVLWSLYATSMVTGAAYDAGRAAARNGSAEAGMARFEHTVGGYDADVEISVPAGQGAVTVVITGQNPTMLPDRFARVLPFGTIDRTIEIRNEVFVDG
jgi:hypothetical protein